MDKKKCVNAIAQYSQNNLHVDTLYNKKRTNIKRFVQKCHPPNVHL